MEERIATPLGPVLIALTGDDEGVRLEQCPVSPELPEGMTVDGAILTELIFTRDLSTSVVVTLRFEAAGSQEGDVGTGEHLECVTFDVEGGHLSLASRDMEWLAPEIEADWARYQPSGLQLDISKASAGARLPIGLAWKIRSGSPWPPHEQSTWFAADMAMPFLIVPTE